MKVKIKFYQCESKKNFALVKIKICQSDNENENKIFLKLKWK